MNTSFTKASSLGILFFSGCLFLIIGYFLGMTHFNRVLGDVLDSSANSKLIAFYPNLIKTGDFVRNNQDLRQSLQTQKEEFGLSRNNTGKLLTHSEVEYSFQELGLTIPFLNDKTLSKNEVWYDFDTITTYWFSEDNYLDKYDLTFSAHVNAPRTAEDTVITFGGYESYGYYGSERPLASSLGSFTNQNGETFHYHYLTGMRDPVGLEVTSLTKSNVINKNVYFEIMLTPRDKNTITSAEFAAMKKELQKLAKDISLRTE